MPRDRSTEYKKRKRSPTYHSWNSMIQRCTNSKNDAFKHYGARGITVCETWHKFSVFLTDMGERPEGMTLDRIDVNKPYSKGNCRWSDLSTQNKNRRPFVRCSNIEASNDWHEYCLEQGINF